MLPFLLAAVLTAAAVDRPHVIVAASAGVPDLVEGHVEVFVADHWSIEAGVGVGLIPLTVHAGVRWSPQGMCWGCWNGHAFRLAPGVAAFMIPSSLGEWMAVVDADAAWVWYRGRVGVTAGVRAGAGVAFGRGADGLKLEPAIEVVPIDLGVVF